MFNRYSKYVGIPFKEYGRDPVKDGGLDCYGLVAYILKNELGINVKLYESSSYIKDDEALTANDIINYSSDIRDWEKIDINNIKEGDVILLKLKGRPIHLGLAINNKQMIHVIYKANAIIERFDTFKWENRIWGVRRAAV